MIDSVIVGRREGTTDLPDQMSGALQVHATRRYRVMQGDAIDILHYQKGFAPRQLSGIKDADNARVISASQGFLLLKKFSDYPFITHKLSAEDFHHDTFIHQPAIAAKINCAHATLTKFLFNEVTPDDQR